MVYGVNWVSFLCIYNYVYINVLQQLLFFTRAGLGTINVLTLYTHTRVENGYFITSFN